MHKITKSARIKITWHVGLSKDSAGLNVHGKAFEMTGAAKDKPI